ncbi:MAG: 50S ribosomal protein L1 [Candidatus Saccharimonadales bacterium]
MATETEIKKMKRGELNEFAATLGLNPDEYARIDDLRSAVFTTMSESATEESSETAEETETATPKKTKRTAKSAPPANPPRPRVERRSKRYRGVLSEIDKSKEYEPAEAIALAQKTSNVKFDAAVELHINLGVDPKQADQLVRGTLVLPHGSGKSQRVAALAPDAELDKIKKAGADLAGNETLLEQIGKGEVEFDILVAHPDMMRDLSKHAKTLGPQGLMPSPKAGTVTADVAKTVKELKGGRIEYRVDRYGIIHQIIGRVSFTSEQLLENLEVLLGAVKGSRPSSIKGTYVESLTLTTSMGPAIKLAASSVQGA